VPSGARAAAVLGAVAVLGLACAEYIAAPGERLPRGMQLDSVQFTVDEGQRLPIVATVLDQFGAPFDALPAGILIAWSTADTAVATVDTAGVLAGVAAGTTQVSAAASGAFGRFTVTAPVTVQPLVSAIAAVAGDSQSGTVGQPLATRLAVRVTNRLGAGVPRIPVSFAVVDSGGALDTAVTTTDSTGLASAGWTLGTRAGTDSVRVTTPRLPAAAVTFTAVARPGAAAALVRSSGDSQTAAVRTPLAAPLVVRAVDRYGNGVPGVVVHWTAASGGGAIAPDSVATDAQGSASAQWTLGATAGAQTATASAAGGVLTATFAATATVSVASVTVAPGSVSLASGATQQFAATPKDSAGNPIAGRTATWTTSDSTVAKVSTAGLATAVKVGTATLTASVGGVSGTATVTVTPGPASTTTSQVSVSAPTVIVGGAVTFTLTSRDAAGNALTAGGLTVGFTTSGGTSAGTTGAVTDKANGTYTAAFTATAAGSPVTVGATIGGQPVTSTLPTLQVLADTVVASVAVTPAVDTVASGATVQLAATPKNAGGTVLTGKPVTWTTADSTIAKVSGTGVVTGALAGTVQITATVQGVAGTASVTVKAGAVSPSQSFVTVSASAVNVGGTVGLKLTTRDAAGNPLTRGGHTVLFTQGGGTSAGTIGAVADSGNGSYGAIFTATTAGTPVSIGATVDGQAVTATPAPTITVNPGSTNLVHWINTAGGAWETAANWNPARVPTLQDTAVVDAAGAYVVTNNASSVGGVVIGAASGAGAQVRFIGDATVSGAVLVRAGDTLDLQANLIVGSFRNDGTILVENAESGPVALAVDTVGVRTAVNDGTIAAVTGAVVNVTNAIGGLVNHGVVSPGTPANGPTAPMTISGNVTFSTGSVVSIDLAGNGYQQADVVGITGTAALGDTLRVQLLNGYVPNIGDAFVPIVWTAYTGTFGVLKLPPVVSGGMWQTAYTPVGLTLTVVPVPAPTVSAFQGDGQSATVGTAVATAPAVRYVDASSNPVAGVSVTFAVASGGGTIVGPATVTTDASGIATVGGWQLGPTPGPNTLTATVSGSGVRGNPVTFTATALATTSTWTGAVSTDWSNAANWSPALVPGANNDVSIGPAANEPVLTGPSAARSLSVQGSGAMLTIGGQTLTALSLNIGNAGLLIMTDPAGLLDVSGSVDFVGGSEAGGLTAGVLRVGGYFYQGINTSAASFAASGTFRVVMTGTGLQSVTFVDLTGASSFQDLDISASAGINIQSDYNGLLVKGTFTSKPTGAATPLLWGLGRSLTAQQLQVSRLVVDYSPLILNEGATPLSQQLDSTTFQDFRLPNGTAPLTQLTVNVQGGNPTARVLTFTGLTFTAMSSGDTGWYVNLGSNVGGTVLDVVGANVTNGPAFTTTVGSATVNWQ
jgi:uncharacterized protein YjdB